MDRGGHQKLVLGHLKKTVVCGTTTIIFCLTLLIMLSHYVDGECIVLYSFKVQQSICSLLPGLLLLCVRDPRIVIEQDSDALRFQQSMEKRPLGS